MQLKKALYLLYFKDIVMYFSLTLFTLEITASFSDHRPRIPQPDEFYLSFLESQSKANLEGNVLGLLKHF